MNIKENCKILKLSYIFKNYEEEIKEAKQTKKDVGIFLDELLEKEINQRKENGIKKRLRYAKFPIKKYLEDFDKKLYNPEFIKEFDELETLEFIDKKENIILVGTPGAGKTHYAIGLGTKACMEGKSVLFISVPNLIIELKEAMSRSQLTTYKRKFEKYDLVIKKLQNIIHDPKIMNDNLAPYEKAKMLQYKYGYTPQYSEIFFKTLQENGYNMRAEIQDAMFILGNLPNPNHNKEEIKKLINSKVIEDISFNGKNIFTIVSKEYGKLEFELASYFFRENEKMMSYMDITKLPCHCHNHAYYMSKIFPDLYSITSICQADFLNTYYYHTYTYGREENHIIDLCYNSIIEKNQYYNIFEPWEISVIKNSTIQTIFTIN